MTRLGGKKNAAHTGAACCAGLAIHPVARLVLAACTDADGYWPGTMLSGTLSTA
jgi:hypothetical protein